MKTLKERVAIMQAYLDGKPVEFSFNGKDWKFLTPTCTGDTEPAFDWVHVDYRINEDMELKAYNLNPLSRIKCISLPPASREWMRNIINAVKAGEIY